jgi:hypothetical protein
VLIAAWVRGRMEGGSISSNCIALWCVRVENIRTLGERGRIPSQAAFRGYLCMSAVALCLHLFSPNSIALLHPASRCTCQAGLDTSA